ncbi:DNA-binding protein [Methylophilus sp.]|uniref:DNA-binding protein n=1 Tax=Methylophilus sp. TaxID=29541 RepID=UPI0011D9E83A|nr:DNA-binding protein [Methylophilus sp.]TXI46780.1 MAG: hypothetical protein E6Q52_01980 [Methylophilus sp.]
MKESKIKYEDIKIICEKLVAEGEKPTAGLIRNILGYGSYTTITDHLRRWNKTLPTINLDRDEIAEEIITPLKNLFQKKFDNCFRDYQFKIIELNKQLNETYDEKIQAEVLYEAQAVLIDKLSTENIALRSEIDLLKAKLTILDDK